VIGTALLLLMIFAITDERNTPPGANMTPLMVGLIVVVIGMAFGGMHGYANNPARRIISFRVSVHEHESLARICSERGMRSISDMARIALQHLAADGVESDPLASEIRELRSNLNMMAKDLDLTHC